MSSRSQLSISRLSTFLTSGRWISSITPVSAPKETHLSRICRAEVIAADGDNAIERSKQGGAVAKRIQRANFDQTFERAFANSTQIHAAGEVIQVGEFAVRCRVLR